MALRQHDKLSLIGKGPIKSSPHREKVLLVSTDIIHDVLFQKYWIVDTPDNSESHWYKEVYDLGAIESSRRGSRSL